jgi:hypothetical protein
MLICQAIPHSAKMTIDGLGMVLAKPLFYELSLSPGVKIYIGKHSINIVFLLVIALYLQNPASIGNIKKEQY